jgi:hypothetical protein
LERGRQRRIVAAVLRGEAVDDRDDAKVAIEFADWLVDLRRGWWHVAPVLGFAVGVGPFLWAWAGGRPVDHAHFVVMALIFVVVPTIADVRMTRGRHRALRSQEATRARFGEGGFRDSTG